MPSASVVVPVLGALDMLARCLDALRACGADDLELIVVDRGSDPVTREHLRALGGEAHVLRQPADAGTVAALNAGVRAAGAPVVVLLSPRIEVRPGWLEPLVEEASLPAAGFVAPRVLTPAGRVARAGMALVGAARVAAVHRGLPGDHPAVTRTRSLRIVSDDCAAVARDVLLDAGALDLAFTEDLAVADACLRLEASGRAAVLRGDAAVVLHGADAEPANEDAMAFRARWHREPPDWADLMAEDGVEDAGWADCRWEGPLWDGTPEAAAGREAVRAMAADGRRPQVLEPDPGPLDPDAAGECDAVLMAAFNRYRIGVPGAEVVRHPGAAAPRSARAREGLGWLGPLRGRSGYAAAGRGIVHAAARAGLPLLALPDDQAPRGLSAPHLPLPEQDFAPGLFVVHGLPVMPSGHPHWEHVRSVLGLPIIGATCFETELMPPAWVGPCNEAREVWVPSGFNARTFAEAGVDAERIHVVPYPVDTDALRPRPRERSADDPVTFLSIFEWTWRKGWDVLLRAWAEEFRPDEPVRLVVVTYRGAGAAGEGTVEEQAVAHLATLGVGPDGVADIELVLDPVPHDQMAELYASSDAFVLPTRGEGAGMPVLEAAACGVPVIATAWGGHEELMTPEASFPVALDGMVEAPRELLVDNPLYRGLLLAEPGVASLRAAMRAVADDPAAAAARGLRGRALVEERFSLDATAAALRARARALLEQPLSVAR